MNNENVSLAFVGDISISQDFFLLDENVKSFLSGVELLSCNLEGPFLSESCKKIEKAGPVLGQPEHVGLALIKLGFNIFSLANNHIMDYGENGLKHTIHLLSRQIIVGAGLSFKEAYGLKKKTLNGVVLGFLSFGEAEFGYLNSEIKKQSGFAWINDFSTTKVISEAKKEVDLLFVQIHAGAEYSEIPLPEWRLRYKEICDAGADVIIGHHPHVKQGWELYNNSYIFYSLGNFYFDSSKNKTEGFVVKFILNQKKIASVALISVSNKNNLIVVDSESKEIENLLCSRLNHNYLKSANSLAVERWQNYYLSYYRSSLFGHFDKYIPGILFLILEKILKRKFQTTINYNLLLHNIRIETHRWLCIRALEVILHKRTKGTNEILL